MPKLELLIIEDVAGKVDVWTKEGRHIAASRTEREDHLQKVCFDQDKQIGLLKDSHKEMSKKVQEARDSRDHLYRDVEKSLTDVLSMAALIDEHIERTPLPKDWRENLKAARDSIMERSV